MRQFKTAVLLAIAIALCVTAGLRADNWPQIGGPTRDCISAETGLIQEWPEGGPKVLWTVEVGKGYAGPVVYDGEVYLLDRVTGKQDILRCLSLETGEELWRHTWDAKGAVPHPGSRAQALVEEKYVFAAGPKGDLYCVDRKTHKPLWHKNVLDEYNGKLPKYGFNQTPLAYKDTLILTVFGKDAGVVALDKETGKEVWASQPFEDLKYAPYASPLLVTINGEEQVLAATFNEIASLDPDTGKFLWHHTAGWHCKRMIVTPTYLGDGRILRTGGYQAGTEMLRVEKKDDGTFETSTLWKTDSCNCQIHQPLPYQGHLYILGNSNRANAGLMCFDMAGSLKWKTGRSPNFGRGGMILADGRIFAVDATTGKLHLIKPDPEDYQNLGNKTYLERAARPWAPLALSEGKLIIRDWHQMKCLDIRAQ